MKTLNLALNGKRGLLVCLSLAGVFIWMKFAGAIDDSTFTELVKWDLLGFFGAKGAEYLPKLTGSK